MPTIYDIKKKADELAGKSNANSISPIEVGGLFRDLADYVGQVETDGGALGIRKVYISVAAMETDEEPVGFDGKPLKRGNLVTIYNAQNAGEENGRIYVYQKPGWGLMDKIDAGYATRAELEKLANRDIVMSETEYEALPEKKEDAFYYIYEEE